MYLIFNPNFIFQHEIYAEHLKFSVSGNYKFSKYLILDLYSDKV